MDSKTENTMTDMTVANTIATQLGSRALYMIGAKNLHGDEKSMSMKVMRNSKRVTHITITLDPSDTYTVEFINCNTRRAEMRQVLETVEGVYTEMLHEVIARGTNLALSL